MCVWLEQVLTKDCSSNRWVRDPERSTPLEIVKDEQGKIYVRAQVHHFCRWSLFKKKKLLDMGKEEHKQERIPREQRRRHQSVIKNGTDGNVDIHVYAMRMSQWSAAVESAAAGASVEGIAGGNVEFSGSLRKQVNAAALLPQMVTIRPGCSHWFEIPRVGTGLISSRKAVMAIVTTEPDGQSMRYEHDCLALSFTACLPRSPLAFNLSEPCYSSKILCVHTSTEYVVCMYICTRVCNHFEKLLK